MVEILRWIGLAVWIIATGVCAPAAYRVVSGNPRSLDLLWCAALALALNRIAFAINYLVAPTLLAWCHATAIAGALFWIAVVRVHQRHDS